MRSLVLRRGLSLLLVSLVLGGGRSEAAAQGVATLGPVKVITLANARIDQLAVSVNAGSVQSIAAVQDNAVNSFPTPVVIQTTWDVNPGQVNSISLVAYFTAPAQAITGNAIQIPSSRVLGRMTTGLPIVFTRFNQAVVAGAGSAGGSLELFRENIAGTNKGKLTRTDNLDLQLDLVGFPDLPVGSYTGTLNIRAVAQ
jgi:outer membrane murein-binding lipoprotein Lpp